MPCRSQSLEILIERSPIDGEVVIAIKVFLLLQNLIVDRAQSIRLRR